MPEPPYAKEENFAFGGRGAVIDYICSTGEADVR